MNVSLNRSGVCLWGYLGFWLACCSVMFGSSQAYGLVQTGQTVQSRQSGEEATDSNEIRYGRCIDLAMKAPDRAIDAALAWRADGGGVPARHCEAMALFSTGEYAEAAARFELLVEDMRIGREMPIQAGERMVASEALLADIFSQAANAWLLAGNPSKAMDNIEAGLSILPDHALRRLSLLVDRARIAAADEDFSQALSDLQTVRAGDPARLDILLFTASAHRALGEYDKALEVVNDYLATFGDDPLGYLERAHALDALSRLAEARRDYLKVIDLAPETPLAEQARVNIERLALEGSVQTQVKGAP